MPKILKDIKRILYSSLNIIKQKYQYIKSNIFQVRIKSFTALHKQHANGKKVLFWRSTSTASMILELIIALALKLRGYKVAFVVCDGIQSACIHRLYSSKIPLKKWKNTCNACAASGLNKCRAFDMEVVLMSTLVPQEKQRQLRHIAKSVDIGNVFSVSHHNIKSKHFLNGALKRFFRGKPYELWEEEFIREFLYGFLTSAEAAEQSVKQFKPDHIFASHCVYTDFGPILAAAKNHHIQLTSFSRSYLKLHYFFGNISFGGKKNIREISKDTWQKIKADHFTPQHEQTVIKFQLNRYKYNATDDMENFPKFNNFTKKQLQTELDIQNDYPIWCLYTQSNWDETFEVTDLLFDPNEWVSETINYLWHTSNINLIVKIHPVEHQEMQEFGVHKYIKDTFPSLPKHIKIVPPDTTINPLELLLQIDGGITMCGTSGIELAVLGKPVILAGKAYYSGLGFTHDALSIEVYKKLIQNIANIKPLSKPQIILARKYAYTLFNRQQIPIDVGQKTDFGPVNFKKLSNLLPGNSNEIDLICDKIFHDTDFIIDDPISVRTA